MAVTTTDVEKRNITITLANEDGEEYRMETKTESRYFIETFFICEKSFTWYYNKHGKGKVKVEYVNGDEEMVAYIDHKETTWGNGGGNWVRDPETKRFRPVLTDRFKVLKKTKTRPCKDKAIKYKRVVRSQVIRKPIHVDDEVTVIADISANHASKLLFGRTQSGKSYETTKSLVERMVVDECTGIYICRDYTQELMGQVENMSDTLQELVGDEIEVVPVYGNSTRWREIVESIKNKDNSRIYLIMGNASVFSKITACFSNGDEIRFTCAVDEADIYVGKDSAVSLAIKKFLDMAIAKYFVSATLLDVSSILREDEFVEAIPSKFAFRDEVVGDDRVYRSLNRVTRYDLKNKDKTLEDAIDNGRQTITEALHYGWNIEYNQKGLPFTICHFHTEVNKVNEAIARGVSAGTYAGHRVPVITFDQNGVRIYENGEITDEPEKLNVAMQKLKDDGHEVVYIMGGKMCSRAFRVTSVDWEMYISLMIYSMGRSSDASLIVQRLGRLCGLTPKRLICPQRVFVSKDVFYKAIDCTNVTTEMVKTVNENPDDRFGDVTGKIVLPKRETRVKLSKKRIEKGWNIDRNKVPMHGIPKEAADEEDPTSNAAQTEPRDENFKIFVPADYDSLNSTLSTVYDRMEEYCSRHYDENNKDEHLRADILNEFVRVYKYDYSTLARRMSDLADTMKNGMKIDKFQHGVNFYTRKDDLKKNKTIYVKYVN
tara:strand:- start:85 stop:2226 length:2142 start_codon:yes stop_codon:yes gene_type:complete